LQRSSKVSPSDALASASPPHEMQEDFISFNLNEEGWV
jgi:hypothetical protein